MSNEANHNLEEYKILKEESKSFTNQTFRDFQLFIGIITIFFALTNSKETSMPKFASYAFLQTAVFVFLTIQFNRAVYLLIVRSHLVKLENAINSSIDRTHIFEWESKVVPSKIAPSNSYSSRSQFAIGVIYFCIFLFLSGKSIQHSTSVQTKELLFPIEIYYWVILPFEFLFILYSLYSIVKAKK